MVICIVTVYISTLLFVCVRRVALNMLFFGTTLGFNTSLGWFAVMEYALHTDKTLICILCFIDDLKLGMIKFVAAVSEHQCHSLVFTLSDNLLKSLLDIGYLMLPLLIIALARGILFMARLFFHPSFVRLGT